jgi:hypothetical protein
MKTWLWNIFRAGVLKEAGHNNKIKRRKKCILPKRKQNSVGSKNLATSLIFLYLSLSALLQTIGIGSFEVQVM